MATDFGTAVDLSVDFPLAASRFSGRKAPPHPGGLPGLPDRITREAYSHEVSSAGFWAAVDFPIGAWSYCSGLKNVANAVYRRVSTDRASIRRHPDYGLNLVDLLGSTITPLFLRTAEQAYAREVEKDERIDRCVCSFTYSPQTSIVTARFQCSTAAGPFVLVLAASDVTVTIVESPE